MKITKWIFIQDRRSVWEHNNAEFSHRKHHSYYAIIIHTNESSQEPMQLPEPFIDKVTVASQPVNACDMITYRVK